MASRYKLFIDANYFCALYNEGDSQHRKAISYENILNESLVFTSNFILLETYTIVSQRAGKSAAVFFGDDIQNQSKIQIISTSTQIEKISWKIFKGITNKNISYVDCSILAILKTFEINSLLSFDSHFKNLQEKFTFKLI